MAEKEGKPMSNNEREMLLAQIAKLQADNAALARKKETLTLKIGEKGGLSVYGLGRFPVTLYKSQWLKLLSDAVVKAVKDYIAEHDSELAEKPGN